MLQTDMDYMTWQAMFGNGAMIGTMPIIINHLEIPLLLIHKALQKVMIQWKHIHQKEVCAAEAFYAMIVIAADTELHAA